MGPALPKLGKADGLQKVAMRLGWALLALRRWIRTAYGAPGLLAFAALIFLLEGIGTPIPVEIPLGIVGVQMSRGNLPYGRVVLVTWLSTLIGNTIGYALGYYGGRPLILKLLQWIHVDRRHLETAEKWFGRHGLKLAVSTRWINWGFAQNIWLLGISRTSFATFITVMAVNDLLWAMAWDWIAWHFARRLVQFTHLHRPLLLIALAMFLIGLGLYFVWRRSATPPKPPAPPADEHSPRPTTPGTQPGGN